MLEAKYQEFEKLQRDKRLMAEFDLESDRELHQFILDDMINFTEQMALREQSLLLDQTTTYTNYLSNLNSFFGEYKNILSQIAELSGVELNLLDPNDYIGKSSANIPDIKSIGSAEDYYKYIKSEDWDWINSLVTESERQEAMITMAKAGKMAAEGDVEAGRELAQEERKYKANKIASKADGTGLIDATYLKQDDLNVINSLKGKDKEKYAVGITNASEAYAKALAAGDTEGMRKAAEEAKKIRSEFGYTASNDGTGIKKYSNGIEVGPVTYTGLAMLHGSKSNPEYVLTNDQAYNLLYHLATSKPEFESCYGDANGTQYIVQGDIVLNEVDDAANFWDEVTKTMSNRYNVTKNKR